MTWRLIRGAIRFFSERYGGRPFVDCLICAIMVVLRFMGYVVRDGDQKIIRGAMPGAPAGGTSVAQNFAALTRLGIPHLPTYGGVSTEALLAGLKVYGQSKRGHYVYAIILRNRDLPDSSPTKRITGLHYAGKHSITIVARNDDGSQVYVLNPMGRDAAHPPRNAPDDWEPYAGNWEPLENLLGACSKTASGNIKAVFGRYNEARQQPPQV